MPSAKDLVFALGGGAAILGGALIVAREVNDECSRAEKVLKALGPESPLVVPYIDKVAPVGCDLSEFVRCSRLDSKYDCIEGRLYGPGVGGTELCDVGRGTPIPCFSGGDVPDADQYDKVAITKRDVASAVYYEVEDKDPAVLADLEKAIAGE